MICQRKKLSLSKGKYSYLVWIGVLLIAQTVSARPVIDMLNPGASVQSGGWGGLNIGGGGSGPGGYGGQAASGPMGVDVRRALVQVQSTNNKELVATDMATLKGYQDAFTTVLASPVPPFGVDMQGVQMQFVRVQRALVRDPILTRYPNLYILPAASESDVISVDPMEARKALVQLASSTNKDLYNTDRAELKKYQGMFSELIASPVRLSGVPFEEVKQEFVRVQRALAKDPVLMQYPDMYELPKGAMSGGANLAIHQKIQSIVNRWIITQANLIRLTSTSSMANDRQTLVSASLIPDLPPVLKNQVELSILQIDAVQLRMLNTEIEKVDFEQQIMAFKKAMVLKAQNPRSVSSTKTVDVNWLVERIENYADLMGKISERGLTVNANADLIQGIKLIEKRAKDNLSKVERYQEKFREIAESPTKRINLVLQEELEKVYGTLAKMGNPVDLLKNRNTIATYESVLKRSLTNYQDLEVGISVMEIRKQYQDVQKAQGVLAFSQLRTFEKKANDLVAKYGVMPLGTGPTYVDKSLGDDNLPEEAAEAAAVVQREAKAMAKLILAKKLEDRNAQEKEAIEAADKKVKAAEEALNEVKSRLERNKKALELQNKNLDKDRSARKETEVKAIHTALTGVMEAMDQLAQATLEGVFVLGDSFGSGDVTTEMARDLIHKINQILIGLAYEPATTFNKQLLGQAKGAEKRIHAGISKMERGATEASFNVKSMQEDLKYMKLALIYGLGDDARQGDVDVESNMQAAIAEANTALLRHLLKTDLAELSSKFSKKMENITFALSTLDRLEKLLTVEDTQGPGRQQTRDLMDRMTTFLDKK